MQQLLLPAAGEGAAARALENLESEHAAGGEEAGCDVQVKARPGAEMAGKNEEEDPSMVSLPELEKEGWKINETSMNLRKRVYHGIENDEGCLLVVVAGVGTRRFGRKSSSESLPERKV
jgi:hypothetical protein